MKDFSSPAQLTKYPGSSRLFRLFSEHIATVCLVIFLLALWPLIHRYKGLAGDAGLYAVQALARIHPNLAGDLFLQNNSQDNYTVFPVLYAWCIRCIGLHAAAMTLVIALKIWFFAGAWALAHHLFDRSSAFFSTAMVIIVAGSYGGYSVFNYSEDWLTARTLAEPMVITALWLYFRDLKAAAFIVATAALFVHPLMALPGLALLLLLHLPQAIGTTGAILAVAVALAAAILAMSRPADLGYFSIMDTDWIEIVRERSVFLFPNLWPASNWEMNAVPFASLVISSFVLSDPRVTRLSITVALVGSTGLAIALIGSMVAPVEILLQGQAWRWVWITRFIAIILLAPALLKMWREQKAGPLCAMLTALGWTLSPATGLICLTMSLMVWWARRFVTQRWAGYLRCIAIFLLVVLLAWTISQSWIIISTPGQRPNLDSVLVTNFRNSIALGSTSITLAGLLIYWLGSTQLRVYPALLSVAFLICCILLYGGAFRVPVQDGSVLQIEEFSEWRDSIAPDDTVFVAPAHNSAAFAWFTLQRPSYLTVDQSAGVVFSRATALEVQRRSEVLSPLIDPDWKLLSEKLSKRTEAHAIGRKEAKTLTRDILIAICTDPKLNFVVAREKLGFGSISYSRVGNWKDWNLYDCRRVLSESPAA